MNSVTRTILSYITFYLGWWACALGAANGTPWLGPALLPAWLALHLYFSPFRRAEALMFFCLGVIGFSVDSLLLRAGLFSTGVDRVNGLAPMWLVAMLIQMGLTFESMKMVRRNRWILMLSGAVSGPISYYFGEALHVIHYAEPLWRSLLLHGALWAALMPLLFRLRDFCLRLGEPSPEPKAD